MKTPILTSLIAAAFCCAIPSTPVFAEDAAPITDVDRATNATFMETASQANWTEVKLGELAQSRTKRGDVKAYADLIVQHHKNAQQSLKDIMDAAKIDLPKDIRVEQQAAIDDLKKTDDSQFDRMFVKRMVVDHQAAVAAYEAFIASTKSPELKNYANITVDHLRQHLASAQELAKVIGGIAEAR